MSYDRPRAAVIGTGFIGNVHAEAIRRAGGELVGMMGSTPERAHPSAARHGTRVFRDLDEVATSGVDVVHIASPNPLHAEQAAEMLRAGKHVICEKPLTTDFAEARALAELASSRGLVHAVCFNLRCYPLLEHARTLVARGDIGEPRLVTGSYLQDWMLYSTDWNWRIDPGVPGTRAVSDIGSHWLDATSYLTGGTIDAAYAQLHTFLPVRERPAGNQATFAAPNDAAGSSTEVEVTTEDAAQLLLRYSNGARGALTVSQVSPGRKNSMSFQIDGADSSLAWASDNPDELWIGHRGRPNETLIRDPSTLAPSASEISFYPGGHVEGFGETFRGLFERVYADVRSGGPASRPNYPTFAAGVRMLAIDEAVRASAAQDRWVEVEGIDT